MTTAPPPERHASWIELFFDLVVVAGVLQLSHLLADGPTAAGFGLFVLLYLAFWTAWAAFTVYGNTAGDRAWVPSILVAMLGLAVMVAAVPEVATEHSLAFALAYVFLRMLSGRLWRPGQIVVDWPLAQVGIGTLPWIVSFWVAPPVRYVLWGIGLVLDLYVLLSVRGPRMIEATVRLVERKGRDPRRRPPSIEAVRSDVPHLLERLGLFVIIVLGEGVIQITTAVSEAEWDWATAGAGLGAFALLAGLWGMSFLHGYGGVPKLGPGGLPMRLTLALHAVTAGAVAVLAAGLGLALAHPHDPVADGVRWLLCGGLAVYVGIAVSAAVVAKASVRHLLPWALPCLLLPLALGAFAAGIGAVVLVWLLVATVGWQLLAALKRRATP